MKRSHRVEAVSVCIGYSDFLNESAKWNLPHLDSWTIITNASDEGTREVCRKYNLRVLISEDGSRHGNAGFNKGRLVDRALCLMATDSWRLHLDSDIALPHGFRTLVQNADLRDDSIYGCDRINVYGWDEWKRLKETGFMNASLDYHCRVNVPQGFTIGVRWAHPIHGYVPIGFFQMWHSGVDEWRGIRIRNYSHAHNNACRTDVQFGMLWDRPQRALIPELLCAHLMSGKVKNGANWNGRTTSHFGPPVDSCGPSNIGS